MIWQVIKHIDCDDFFEFNHCSNPNRLAFFTDSGLIATDLMTPLQRIRKFGTEGFIAENWEDEFTTVRKTADVLAKKVKAHIEKLHPSLTYISNIGQVGTIFNLRDIYTTLPNFTLALVLGSPRDVVSAFGSFDRFPTEKSTMIMTIPCLKQEEGWGGVGAWGNYKFVYAWFKEVFVHELTHYWDTIRGHMKGAAMAGPEDMAKGSYRGDLWPKIYFNIGSELNAFTDHMIYQFEKLPAKQKAYVTNMHDMIEVMLRDLPHSPTFTRFFNNLTPHNHHKVMKRLADYFHRKVEPNIDKRNLITRSATRYDMPSQAGRSKVERKVHAQLAGVKLWGNVRL